MMHFPLELATIATDNHVIILKNTVYEFDYSHISLLVGQYRANHFGKWLAIWQFCTANGQ